MIISNDPHYVIYNYFIFVGTDKVHIGYNKKQAVTTKDTSSVT